MNILKRLIPKQKVIYGVKPGEDLSKLFKFVGRGYRYDSAGLEISWDYKNLRGTYFDKAAEHLENLGIEIIPLAWRRVEIHREALYTIDNLMRTGEDPKQFLEQGIQECKAQLEEYEHDGIMHFTRGQQEMYAEALQILESGKDRKHLIKIWDISHRTHMLAQVETSQPHLIVVRSEHVDYVAEQLPGYRRE